MLNRPHRFHPTVLREYDIRGIVGETLTQEDAESLGLAFGTMARRRLRGTRPPRIKVGRDGRLTSPDLEAALVRGLMATGATVEVTGLGPTPMLYFSVFEDNADGGIMVTGSHNPPDYNGFKMMLGKDAVYGERIQELGRMAATLDLDLGGVGRQLERPKRGAYVERLLADVAEGHFKIAPLKVVWDPGNGAAAAVLAEVLAGLPGEHIVINGTVDGTFPAHHPDPTVAENLTQVIDRVRAEKADLGIAFDGDGDRIGAVDADGQIVWGDQLLAMLADDVLADMPGATIIADVKASQVLFEHIAARGGTPLMWKTGHSLIKTKMQETQAPLAGEMSGHIFFKHRYYGFDDALYAAIRLLVRVSRARGGLAALRRSLPQVVNTPELRFSCPEHRKFAIVPEVRERLSQSGAQVDATDGVRVTTADGWWLLRPSNTQDVLVARCEAPDHAALDRLKNLLAEQLRLSGLEPPVF
jgi:phosphomannomutase